MNKSKCVSLCALVCILFFAALTATHFVANAVNATIKAGFEYVPEHSEIVLGEPLYVTFSVTNQGFATFYLETGGDYRMAVRPGRFSFKAIDTNGVAAKDPHPDASNIGGFVFLPEVKPHSAYSEKLFLPLWIKFDHAGQYRVHVERSLQLYADSTAHREAAVTNLGTYDFYVTVLPANSNLLGSRIQELGEQTKVPEQAYDATLALAYIDDKRVVPYLLDVVEAYKGKGNSLYPGIEGLGRHPTADSTKGLIKLLNDPKRVDAAEYEIIEALSKMNSPEAKDVLRESLSSPSAFTRKTVAKFLGQMNDRDSINAIKAHLTDTNSEVRLACANALVRLNAFANGLNSPVMLAHILDTENPSVTNRYNDVLFSLIASSGGPYLFYNFSSFGETTEKEVLDNKESLAAMLRWANSPNAVSGH